MNRVREAALVVLVSALAAGGISCKKAAGGGGSDGGDGATDGSGEPMATRCLPVDGGPASDDAGTTAGTDEFGPNAPEAKTASSLGRVNVFEVTAPARLDRVDIYLRADLPHTRLTIAVQEAVSRTAAFNKVADVQIDVDVCEGWATSGALAIPLVVGRFYAIGYDPNQEVTPFVSTDGDTLPIDGMFGRLIGSRTATSVSVPNLTWDKFTDKEYNRQRIVTSPRAADPAVDGGADAAGDSGAGAGTDGSGALDATDGAAGDATRG